MASWIILAYGMAGGGRKMVSCLILSCQCLVLDSHVYPYGGGRRQGRCRRGYTLTSYVAVSRNTWRSRCYCAAGWRGRRQIRCDTWQCCPNQYDPYYPYDPCNPFFPNFPLNPIPTIRTPTNLASLKIEREKAAQLFSMPQTLILFAEAITFNWNINCKKLMSKIAEPTYIKLL